MHANVCAMNMRLWLDSAPEVPVVLRQNLGTVPSALLVADIVTILSLQTKLDILSAIKFH